MNQLFRNLLEQLADASSVAEVQVQVVDEDQKNASRRVARGPRRRQDDSLLHGRRRRGREVGRPSTVDEREGDDVLFYTVLEDGELFFLQIGNELSLRVADDHVGSDDVHAAAEDVPLRILRACSGSCRRSRARRRGRGRRRGVLAGGGFCACVLTPSANASVDTARPRTRPESFTCMG